MASQTTPTPHVKAYSYIRFSTPEQASGDSLRRQATAATAYAKLHGLELDNTLTLRDLGVSAFRGANAERGALKAFLKAVEAGSVPRGSYLLVESLDRLSRDKVTVALNLFLDIIHAGINLVTLMDNRLYSQESVDANFTELIVSIAVMSRAHEESAVKSDRRRATWNQQKRDAATAGHKMSKKLPFWLSLPDPTGDFVVVEEAAGVVRRVFELARSGLGYHKIAQALNAEGVPSPAARSYATSQKYDGNPRTWATSSIGHLLRNEAAIGNLVMPPAVVKADEAHVPERLDGYYPRIVDDELFYAVQGKRQPPRGKSSALKTNLFTGLLFCGYCRGPLQVDTNTKVAYRRSRIICQRKRRGLGCICKSWPYEEFEDDFFSFIHEVQLDSVMAKRSDNDELAATVDELTGRLADTEKRLARLTKFIEEEDAPPATIRTQLAERERERATLAAELGAAIAKLESERSYQRRAGQEIAAIREQVTTLRSLSTEERVIVRYAVAERIAAVVESISLWPNGSLLRESAEVAPGEVEPDDEAGVWSEPDTTPFFVVKFRNGWSGVVKPSDELSHRLNLDEIDWAELCLPPNIKVRRR